MMCVCVCMCLVCTTLKGNIRTKLPYRDRGDNNGGKITAYMMGFCVCIYGGSGITWVHDYIKIKM